MVKRVSVVIPVRNGAQFVGEAIESVYDQTLLPDEVIVVDDGSTDETPDILRRFHGRPEFRSFRQPSGGEASARNAGVARARNEYIAFLDHDDLWQPEKLELQLASFEPMWAMSFTAYEVFAPTTTTPVVHERWAEDPKAVVRRLEHECCVRPPSAVMIRRSVLRSMGPFEQVARFGTDWLMWLRIAAAGHLVGYLPEPLTRYRWHGSNLSNNERDFFDCACGVFDRYGDRRLRAWWRLNAAVHAYENRDLAQARRRLREAARIRPLAVRPGWLTLII